jgi:hypothetical protein
MILLKTLVLHYIHARLTINHDAKTPLFLHPSSSEQYHRPPLVMLNRILRQEWLRSPLDPGL